MSYEDVRARLNLYAVLPNLEDVVAQDAEMRELVKEAAVTIRFVVKDGPRAYVSIFGGACTVGRGRPPGGGGSRVVLWFTSPRHLNRMFDGKANPIPLWGFHKLGFLKNEFTRLTERLAHYLAPTDELLADPDYLALNTRLTLNTAAFAVPELLRGDERASHFRQTLSGGAIALTVAPDGPSVGLRLDADGPHAVKGGLGDPTALVRLRDLQIANAFLNGKLDTFAAVARGDVEIRGQIDKVDALGLVLDRIPIYLS